MIASVVRSPIQGLFSTVRVLSLCLDLKVCHH